MPRHVKCFLFLLLFGWLYPSISPKAFGQTYKEEFGKNRIQYDIFDWSYFSSRNFEVYFYGNNREIAEETIAYLESDFRRITETIGYPPLSKIRVFLYGSVREKQQSNVGLNVRDFKVGGETNFIKSQVELAIYEDRSAFKQEAILAVTNFLVEEMIYGGSIGDLLQNSFSGQLPDWVTEGMARYVAYGWSKEMDDVVRKYVTSIEPISFQGLDKSIRVILGQSIWNYIVQNEGRRNLSNIMNLARIIRNEESSIQQTLNESYAVFMANWRSYYLKMNAELSELYETPNEEYIISGVNKKNRNFGGLKFNASGKYLAYTSSKEGGFNVHVVDMELQREEVIFSAGERIVDQEVFEGYPILSWADSVTLGIVYSEAGKNVLAVKRVGSKGEQKINIPTLNTIQSFDFKRGGRLAVLSGTIAGVNNVFVYNLVRNQIRKISDDKFDERDISFLAGTNQVVFVSNRDTDSVFVNGPDELEKLSGNQFNIYSYDLDDPDSQFVRLTNVLATTSSPQAVNEGKILFLSDQQGINNLYRSDLKDSLSNQVTKFLYGLQEFSYDPVNGRLAFISNTETGNAIYLQNYDIDQNLFTPVTPRRGRELAIIVNKRKVANAEMKSKPDSVAPKASIFRPAAPEQRLDTLKEGAINTENYEFENKMEERKVRTSDYQFEKPEEDPTTRGKSFLQLFENQGNSDRILGPAEYETRFQTEKLVTSYMIDEIRSFSLLLELQMADYLQNHKFRGSFLVPMSLSSGYDVDAEYFYMKSKVDLKARYYRKVIAFTGRGTFTNQRYALDRVEIGGLYPLNSNMRLEVNPFFTQANYVDRDIRLLIPSNNPNQFGTQNGISYLGLNAAFIYDNSVIRGTNLHEGTRAKASFESHQALSGENASFNQLKIDARHYYRVNKGIYLAARFFYGSYFGSAPKQFLLGGVDNWAFNDVDSPTGKVDPLSFTTLVDNSDILFHEFTNLRGYNYNALQGRNVLTFSGEIRLPINELLKSSTLQSNFFQNLQIIGFYDLGSSWDNLSPFMEQNNVNLEEISNEGSPFSAIVNNFSNPWLQSTGVGVRTMLFGFFSRMDLSFPIRDFEVGNPQFQLSFGYDF